MKITLDIQPEQTVASAATTFRMNIGGPYTHWPRRQSK
jgi:hypothetical protein